MITREELLLYHEYHRRGAPNIKVYLNKVSQEDLVEFIVWDGTTRDMSRARFVNLYEHIPNCCQACKEKPGEDL